MLKTLYKNLFWIALPLGLAVGCAENRPQAEASYGPPPNVALEPTSSRPDQQIYSNSGSPIDSTQLTPPPAGADVSSWVVGEEIQQKLITDTTLAPFGSSLVAEVSKDGTVTLRGNVSSASEQQRVSDSIASLPGVHGINNQLIVGRNYRNRTVDTQNY